MRQSSEKKTERVEPSVALKRKQNCSLSPEVTPTPHLQIVSDETKNDLLLSVFLLLVYTMWPPDNVIFY